MELKAMVGGSGRARNSVLPPLSQTQAFLRLECMEGRMGRPS